MLQPVTAASYALDIPCSDIVTIALARCPYKLKFGIKESILLGTVGLLLGRSSLALNRITVHVGIIDYNHVGGIIIVISVPTVGTFERGECTVTPLCNAWPI